MKGVLLAGGEGKRLENPLYNKHLALVYDKLMIQHSAGVLGRMGCNEITVVTSPDTLPQIQKVLGEADYRVQPHPLGSADALSYAEGLEGTFPVLCGDVYLDPAPTAAEPTLFWTEFEGAQNHSVLDIENQRIVEKPQQDIGQRAVIAYFYDDRVFEVIKTLNKTERGEYELVDLHQWYLDNGANVEEFTGFFGDMGTPDGLLRVANYIKENHGRV